MLKGCAATAMEVKKYLEQIEKYDRIIENKLEEKQRWHEIATSITVQTEGEKVKSSGRQQKMADAVDMYIDLEREIDLIIAQRAQERQTVINTLELLPALEYDVLYRQHVKYQSFDDIAEAHAKSYSWATSVYGQALQSLQKLLDDGR